MHVQEHLVCTSRKLAVRLRKRRGDGAYARQTHKHYGHRTLFSVHITSSVITVVSVSAIIAIYSDVCIVIFTVVSVITVVSITLGASVISTVILTHFKQA